MWDKYDISNISLVEIASAQCSNMVTGNNLSVNVNMSGLPFINSEFNPSSNNMSNNVTLGTFCE
jgi:hypothetical protein